MPIATCRAMSSKSPAANGTLVVDQVSSLAELSNVDAVRVSMSRVVAAVGAACAVALELCLLECFPMLLNNLKYVLFSTTSLSF